MCKSSKPIKCLCLYERRSSGKVDIKNIVAFHERIYRTAALVGITLPKGRSKNRHLGYDPSTDSDSDSLFGSHDSGSGSDSDDSSILSLRRSDEAQVKESGAIGPPPPPVNWPGGIPRSPSSTNPSLLPPGTLAGTTANSVSSWCKF